LVTVQITFSRKLFPLLIWRMKFAGAEKRTYYKDSKSILVSPILELYFSCVCYSLLQEAVTEEWEISDYPKGLVRLMKVNILVTFREGCLTM
jgi:hypothetical protein